MKLSDLPVKSSGIITKINITSKDVSDRLSDFGLQIGQSINCVYRSPLGGPKAYRLSHGVFAIDKELSDLIDVKKDSNI